MVRVARPEHLYPATCIWCKRGFIRRPQLPAVTYTFQQPTCSYSCPQMSTASGSVTNRNRHTRLSHYIVSRQSVQRLPQYCRTLTLSKLLSSESSCKYNSTTLRWLRQRLNTSWKLNGFVKPFSTLVTILTVVCHITNMDNWQRFLIRPSIHTSKFISDKSLRLQMLMQLK